MWKWLVGGAAIVLAVLLWVLPLRWVTPVAAPELAASSVSGSVWRGRLTGAEWRGVALGDLDIGLDPAGLLKGEVQLDFDRAATEVASRLTGRIATGGGTHRIERINGALQVALPSKHLEGVDVQLRHAALSVDAAGRCQDASGEIAARLKGLPVIGTTPSLEGVMRCDGNALLLPLQSAGGEVGVELRVAADRQYTADIRVAVKSRVVQLALAAAGFVTGPGFATLQVAGTL